MKTAFMLFTLIPLSLSPLPTQAESLSWGTNIAAATMAQTSSGLSGPAYATFAASPPRAPGFAHTNFPWKLAGSTCQAAAAGGSGSRWAVSLGAAAVGSNAPVEVMERGPHHRVCQQAVLGTNAPGQGFSHASRWIELATGMHARQADGSWRPADDDIVLTPGGAAATNTQHQVFFCANLNTSRAVRLIMPDGQTLSSTILGLSYSDPATGKAVWIAELKDSVGQLVGRNQVLYTNAFDGLDADVQYINKKSGFQQNVILRTQLPSPQQFGLSADALLQVITEFYDSPAPQKTALGAPPAAAPVAEALRDESLAFGTMKMGPGTGFLLGDERSHKNSLPVRKRWCILDSGRRILVEELPIKTVRTKLGGLKPPRSASSAPRKPGMGKTLMAALEKVLPKQRRAAGKAKMTLARRGVDQQPGFVLDYELGLSAPELTLKAGTTYYLSGDLNVGILNLEAAVVKLEANVQLHAEQVNCLTRPYQPAFFTSKNDDGIGEPLPWYISSGNPEECYGGTGLRLEGWWRNWPYANSIHDCRFRYLNTGILFGPGSLDNTVSNCANSCIAEQPSLPTGQALRIGAFHGSRCGIAFLVSPTTPGMAGPPLRANSSRSIKSRSPVAALIIST